MSTSLKNQVIRQFSEADILINYNESSDIRVLNDGKFFKSLFFKGVDGFADGYVEGYWESLNLEQLLFKFLRSNLPERLKWNWLNLLRHTKLIILNQQKIKQSFFNIEQHYDIGNNLYQNMLGKTMAYSCAYWKDAETLDEAQEAKYDLICRKLKLQPGMKILDAGCGFGTFLKYAAENYDIVGYGVSLSKNQVELGKELCSGLPVTLELNDYRNVRGQFDRIVSIGSIEHCGPKNFRPFMTHMSGMLEDQGMMLIHTIGFLHPSPTLTQPELTWIERNIFPGGCLPSLGQLISAADGIFVVHDVQNFGHYYHKTLMSWADNFKSNWHNIKNNYDERFYRLWEYYLYSCAAAFRCGRYHLWQIVMQKGYSESIYESVR